MNRKIYVTEAGYDDIGSILKSLGEGYKHRTLSWDKNRFGDLSHDDILFVNCHSSCTTSPEKYKKQLRDFVSSGGILYASDWAGALVAEAFGDYLEFSSDGQAGTISAKVVDAGLREILGSQISLNFDLGSWWKISKVKKEGKVFLTYQEKPLLVSFKVNRGYVLYTSFHNKSQVSKLEKALLEYLVFRPILSKVADEAAEQALTANYKVEKEIIASTKNLQSPNLSYPIDVEKPTTILGILSWEGAARFELALEDPQHANVKNIASDKSPIGIEFFAQQIGEWIVKINPLSLPYPNFPFALTLAKGGKKQQVASSISSTAVQGGGNTSQSNQGIPVTQMSPLQPGATPVSNPVIGTTGIVGKTPSQTAIAPVLFPILNMGGLPNYEVRWMAQAGQDGYILQEAALNSFQDAQEIYRGNLTQLALSDKSVGQYFYRVCSYRGTEDSPWSEIQSTTVMHNP